MSLKTKHKWLKRLFSNSTIATLISIGLITCISAARASSDVELSSGDLFSPAGKLVLGVLAAIITLMGLALAAVRWLDNRVAVAAAAAAQIVASAAKAAAEAVAAAAIAASAAPLVIQGKDHEERLRILENSHGEIKGDIRWMRKQMEHQQD